MQTKEELNLADTIKGEINRMCVTDDIAELDTMALHARRNIERLQSLRYASIKEYLRGYKQGIEDEINKHHVGR